MPEVVALTSYCYNYITCLKVALNVSILFKKCICFLFPDMKSLHRYVLQKMKLELPVGEIALAQKLLVCSFLTLTIFYIPFICYSIISLCFQSFCCNLDILSKYNTVFSDSSCISSLDTLQVFSIRGLLL